MENKKNTVRVTDGNDGGTLASSENIPLLSRERLKKPLLIGLMVLVFAGCLYLIFKPGQNKKVMDPGLNEAVPQATDAGLQADKQKAYELEMLENKNVQKQNTLASLADYWQQEHTAEATADSDVEEGVPQTATPALNSYRDAQRTLGDFYRDDDATSRQLLKQVEELKQQLAEKENSQPDPIQTQLTLMEKSYQMAAKYLPGNMAAENPAGTKATATDTTAPVREVVPLTPDQHPVVSALYREPGNSAFLATYSKDRNSRFLTAVGEAPALSAKNSVRAVIHQAQEVGTGGPVLVRLLEPARLQGVLIPQGAILTASARLYQGRLQMTISSVALSGDIFPVDITVYGLDGQPGLSVPYSEEMNALTEIASNMTQASGTSIMMSRSAGQQIAGDLSRGLMQGVSGYISKKLKTPKVRIKPGFQVLLVSKSLNPKQ